MREGDGGGEGEREEEQGRPGKTSGLLLRGRADEGKVGERETEGQMRE